LSDETEDESAGPLIRGLANRVRPPGRTPASGTRSAEWVWSQARGVALVVEDVHEVRG